MKFVEDETKERIAAFFQEFRSELLLIVISSFLVGGSLAIFIRADSSKQTDRIEIKTAANDVLGVETIEKKTLFIDVSGAVLHPDVYELALGSRLRDGIAAAGGLSDKANRDYFYRTYNLARPLQDGEKIYVPKNGEEGQLNTAVNTGIGLPGQKAGTGNTTGVNINTAALSALDGLPGIGPVTGAKIIANRPYQTVDELLSKKVVSKSVFEKIKDKVVVQ